jgi:hypothetical protein
VRVTLLVLALAVVGLIAWYVMQRESPSIVVQRFCSALKGNRFEEAYRLIDWGQENHPNEKQFVQMGDTLKNVVTIRKYTLGEPHRTDNTAIVPVTVMVSLSMFGVSQERTDTIDVRCRFVDGQWKVRPDLKKGFLGLGSLSLPASK